MDNTVVINDYRQMDKVIKEGRQYILNLCKRIKKANCNVLLIQKSILRDAVDDVSLNFLKRLNILVVKDVERDEIDFLSKSLGCKPVADIEAFTEDKLGYADLVEESSESGVKVVKITGIKNRGRTVSILAMGANNLVVEECERSLHDALCVVRCLVKKRSVNSPIPPGLPADYIVQCSHRRWRRTRNPCFTSPFTVCPNPQRHGSILYPGICRSSGSYPNYTGRKCWPQSYRHRN